MVLIVNTAETHMNLHVLLADDDSDDRFFFERALEKVPFRSELEAVEDGEKLMNWLNKNSDHLPDVLFLDVNMPRKNGAECLLQIKHDPLLKQLPVIIYSTSLNEKDADLFYKNGAHYYICKRDNEGELVEVLHHSLSLLVAERFVRPARDKFVLLQC